ncbi:plasmid recombination protein, partial [Clostridium sp. OF09-36]
MAQHAILRFEKHKGNPARPLEAHHERQKEQYASNPDLERGESASKTGRKHIPTRLFKQAVNLSKQARAIEATLDGITPFNAGKKKEEALSLLKKWFPQMENFSGQLKKYKVTINDLLAENEQLEARAKASEKGKMKDTMERAKLESELKDIQRLVDRIPPEVLAELKR